MGNIINTAPCRFCGQMVQIDSEEKLTQPQAEEQATMSCTCEQAVEYQKEKQRKETRAEVQDLHDRVLIVEQSLKSYHKRLDGMNLNIKTDQ